MDGAPEKIVALKFSPLSAEKGVKPCSRKIFCKNYRADVKRFGMFNLNYEDINTPLGGVRPLLLMSWNVRRWTDTKKRGSFDKIVKLVRLQKPDILFLQEATFSKLIKFCGKTGMLLRASHKNFSPSEDGKKIVSYTTATLTKKTVGVGLSFSKTFADNSFRDTRGYVVSQIHFGGRVLNLVNVHLDAFDLTEETRLNQVREILDDEKLRSLPIVIAGDFNSISRKDYCDSHWSWLVENSLLDRDAGSSSYGSLPNKVSDLMKDEEFKDAGATHAANAYTCWTGRRVDYIYHSEDVEASHYSVYFSEASDHFPIFALIGASK